MLYSPGAAAVAAGAGAVAGDVITRVPPIDPASTNLLLQSAQWDVAPWTLTGGATVTPNTTIAPNGATEADTLVDAAGTLGQDAQDVVIANDNGTYWFSAYFTLGTSGQARVGLLLTGGTAIDAFVDFNPASGAAINSQGTFSVEAFSIEGVTWYRVSVKNTNNTSGNVTARCYVQPASLSAATQGTLIAWGAQLEKRATVTQYIPTLTSQVTRVAGQLPNWLLNSQPKVIFKEKLVSEFVANSTVLQADDDLFFPVLANEKWLVEFFLSITTDAATGIKFGLQTPAGGLVTDFGLAAYGGGTSWGGGSFGAHASGAAITIVSNQQANAGGQSLRYSAYINNGSTPGNVTLFWAQLVSGGASAGVFLGSILVATKLN